MRTPAFGARDRGIAKLGQKNITSASPFTKISIIPIGRPPRVVGMRWNQPWNFSRLPKHLTEHRMWDRIICRVRSAPDRARYYRVARAAITRGLPFERLAFPVSAARPLSRPRGPRGARVTAYTVCSRFENSQKLLGTSPLLTRIQSAPQKLSHAFSCGRVDVLRAGAPECVTPLLFAPLWSRVGEQEHSTKLPVPVPEPNHRKAQSPHGLPCIRQ